MEKPMAAKEFRAALKKLGHTHSSKGGAALLGVGLRTLQGYSSGEVEIPLPIEKLIKCLLREAGHKQ